MYTSLQLLAIAEMVCVFWVKKVVILVNGSNIFGAEA